LLALKQTGKASACVVKNKAPVVGEEPNSRKGTNGGSQTPFGDTGNGPESPKMLPPKTRPKKSPQGESS